MARHLVRLAVGGTSSLLAATFVLYHLLVYSPGGAVDRTTGVVRLREAMSQSASTLVNMRPFEGTSLSHPFEGAYHLYMPWPHNYTTWLLDPWDTMQLNDRNELEARGVDVDLGGLQIRGSGILTGHLGNSVLLARGTPVLDMYGRGFDLLFAVLLGMVLTFGYVATVQRLRLRDSRALTLDFADVARV